MSKDVTTITIEKELYWELLKLKAELKARTFTELLRKLVEVYHQRPSVEQKVRALIERFCEENGAVERAYTTVLLKRYLAELPREVADYIRANPQPFSCP